MNKVDEIVGYSQHISDEQTSQKGNKYFTLQVQTNKDSADELVCFSPKKANELKKFQERRSPIRLQGSSLFKGTPAINDFTKVSELKNISYKYTELAPLKTS